jgi:hypothetical protein
MTRHILGTITLFINTTIFCQNVSVNNTGAIADPTAILDIQSTSKGILIPRMNTAQRLAISQPAKGLMLLDTNTGSFWFRKSSAWEELVDRSNSSWQEDPSFNLTTKNGGMVNISAAGAPIGTGKLSVVHHAPSVNTNESILQLYRSTSGTAANGISGSVDFFNEVSDGSHQIAGKIISKNINVTAGNQSSSLEFVTSASGIPATQLYIGPINIGIGTANPSIAAKLDVTGNINASGKFIRTSVTGISNLVPLCYGAVSGTTILSGTGNFTVTASMTTVGVYFIENASIDDNCIVVATIRTGANVISCYAEAGKATVSIHNHSGMPASAQFQFVIYKP